MPKDECYLNLRDYLIKFLKYYPWNVLAKFFLSFFFFEAPLPIVSPKFIMNLKAKISLQSGDYQDKSSTVFIASHIL